MPSETGEKYFSLGLQNGSLQQMFCYLSLFIFKRILFISSQKEVYPLSLESWIILIYSSCPGWYHTIYRSSGKYSHITSGYRESVWHRQFSAHMPDCIRFMS